MPAAIRPGRVRVASPTAPLSTVSTAEASATRTIQRPTRGEQTRGSRSKMRTPNSSVQTVSPATSAGRPMRSAAVRQRRWSAPAAARRADSRCPYGYYWQGGSAYTVAR